MSEQYLWWDAVAGDEQLSDTDKIAFLLQSCYGLNDKLEQSRLLNAECERQRKEAWEQVALLRATLRFFMHEGYLALDPLNGEPRPPQEG